MSSTSMGLQLRSTVKKEGIVEITLARVPTPEPKPEEVVVRIGASPINPSDQGLLFAGADLTTVRASGPADNPVVTASIPPAGMKALAGRLEVAAASDLGLWHTLHEAKADPAPAARATVITNDFGNVIRQH